MDGGLCAGVPREHCTDRLSAAFRNLATEEDEAKGYGAFCQHYRMEPRRNNAGIALENGSVEASHGHRKRTLEGGAGAVRLARFRRSRQLSGLPCQDDRPPGCKAEGSIAFPTAVGALSFACDETKAAPQPGTGLRLITP